MNNPKLDIHILLDAYFELNQENKYPPELDETINDIAANWEYVLPVRQVEDKEPPKEVK